MSTDNIYGGDDLFDFPEARGVEDFGFEEPAPALGAEVSAPAAKGEFLEIDPIPNPPVPEGINDLDVDLFDFDSSANAPLIDPRGPAPFKADEAPELEPSAPEVPAPAPVVFETSSADDHDDAEPSEAEQTDDLPTTTVPAAAPSLLRDAGPTIVLPEDLPNSSAWERNRSVVALVGCFLLINTGIFFLAQQASDRFNQTIADATGLMAQVLLEQQSRDAQAAAPANAEPTVEHVIESADPEVEVAEEPDTRLEDPLEYDNTHQLAVGRAKALLSQGKPEEARMLLNFVLANRDRVPLRNSLREEIDYLIPFTYFEQGNLIEPEEAR
ncbi:hypothetical protein N9L90_01205 [Planctomycetota bacterium]|jgi:type IV secretory pathway VirB10-like protein|nr:hypothetical protein [Planctomycetota bacterium]